MIDILIDAPLLACPPNQTDVEAFKIKLLDFVEALVDISNLRRSLSGCRVWRESSLASTLHAIEAYPFKHTLDRAFKLLGSEVGIQPEDVSALAFSLLTKSNCLNEVATLEDFAAGEFEIFNDVIPNRVLELEKYLCRACEFAIAHLGGSKSLPSSVKVASGNYVKGQPPTKIFYVLEMVSYRDGSIECPKINREILLEHFSGSDSALKSIDPVDIWIEADEESVRDAIALLAAGQSDISYGAIPDIKEKIRFNYAFLHSCRKLGFLHEPSKIRRLAGACVDLLMDRNLSRSHWLRKGMGAEAAQKERKGGGAAWRHDIDDEFHLHYWRDGKTIEFANVVVHNDFHIDGL